MFAPLLTAGAALLIALATGGGFGIRRGGLPVAGWLAAIAFGGRLGPGHRARPGLRLPLRRHLLLDLDLGLAVVGEHRQVAVFGEGRHAAVDRDDPLAAANEAG